jgi:hypothetical protein
MLIRSKFEGYKAGIRVYPGKSDPPPPPDYASAAKETAAGNKEAAQFAVNANRINQYTPYGSLTYTKKAPGFDQSGYDSAVQNYNQQLAERDKALQNADGNVFGYALLNKSIAAPNN